MVKLNELIERVERDPTTAAHEIEMEPSRQLAHTLVTIRLERDLSQREFARTLGVSGSYIAKLESGTANPSIRALTSLLRRAGMDLQFTVAPLTGSGEATGWLKQAG